MPGKGTRGRGALTAAVWLLNGSAAVLLLAILFVYFTREPAEGIQLAVRVSRRHTPAH